MQGLPTACARQPTATVSLMLIPDDGLLLNKGWRFQPGDVLYGASPQLDDSRWQSIDPAKDLRELPQLQQAGIAWFRLHIHTGPELPPLMIKVFQSVASEMYLDGRLLYRFGTVSAMPGQVRVYNPVAAFNLPLRPSSDHILAIRVASQPDMLYKLKNAGWDESALQFWVFPATAIPAIKPVDVQAIYLDAFRLGIAFILFILHLSLFFAHFTQRTNLFAAGMYLLLGITLMARVASGLTHSLGLRMLIYYGIRADVLVPGLVVLTFYSLFRFRRGTLFWLAMGSIFLKLMPLPTDLHWLSIPIDYFLPLELLRLSLVAVRRGLPGAYVVTVCAFTNLGLWTIYYVLLSARIPLYDHEWLFHAFYLACFLCFPLTLSLLLASEHGRINRQLIVRLQEVETLSARNLAQQLERQELLSRQNEQLEVLVAERTYELHRQASELRELNAVQSRFVANVTHEFRTPLSLILGPVRKLLQESRFDRPTLAMVERNAGYLLRLVNQLLDLFRLDSNQMAPSLRQGDIPDFVAQIVDLFQRSVEQKGITLTYQAAPFPPQSYGFDADKWEKILTNILFNSLKFTHVGGTITFRITPVWGTDGMTDVSLQIADSGIGIAPEKLPYIFDRFYQADTTSTRVYEGTGIGLALVKELTQLMGGTVAVASEPGVGTTFRLTLPVYPPSTNVNARRVISSGLPTMIGDPIASLIASSVITPSIDEKPLPRLLLVEDNDELREFLVGELGASYHIMKAEDGQVGWEMTQAELPDIVITDVMMPRMDGYELTRRIKENPDTDHIAVVMLTAKAAQPSRIEGLQQGADDYLTKPFSVAELQLRLYNLISRQQKLGEHYRQQFALPQPMPMPGDASPGAVGVPMDSPDPFLRRIYELLDTHLDNPALNVDWLADELAMSRKTVYRKMQSLIQLPPADLIRQYRLRKAAELLRTGRNVSETADLTGFSTPSHFATVFKEAYQQTPTEFMASRA